MLYHGGGGGNIMGASRLRPPPSWPAMRLPSLVTPVAVLLVGALGFAPRVAAAGPVSFRNDVMAVLSRAGCNAGACHGNLNGKGGFKLSLRGDDPDADRAALSRDMLARRADPLRPDDSLLLQKAAGR